MLDQSVKTLQNTDKMCYDFRVCKRLAPSMKTLTKILTKCVMISESLLSRPQVWKHWPKYWHYASWFLSLYELVPKCENIDQNTDTMRHDFWVCMSYRGRQKSILHKKSISFLSCSCFYTLTLIIIFLYSQNIVHFQRCPIFSALYLCF